VTTKLTAVVRMLLGLKTERERKLDDEFRHATERHRDGNQALDEAKQRLEATRRNVHARLEALNEATGGTSER